MAKLYTRILPAAGAIPKPGEDLTAPALWKDYMRAGEVALFCFDEATGELRNMRGVAPRSPFLQICTAVRSYFIARQLAQGLVLLHPEMFCVLYKKNGKWLETQTRTSLRRCNEGFRRALWLLQLLALTVAGLLVVLAASQVLQPKPVGWRDLASPAGFPLALLGLVLGVSTKYLVEQLRISWWARQSKAALEPLGSPGREPFYRELAKNPNLLVPLEITMQPTTITWPQPSQHEDWACALEENKFAPAGQYVIAETRTDLEFWLNPDEGVTACMVNHPSRGMWLSVFTRYEDESSFAVANKDWPGLDPHPAAKIVYLGPEASAQQVLETLRSQRPLGTRHAPTQKNFLEDYKKGWRKQIEWRRARGRTPEEIKRIDERRAAREKAASQTKP